VFYVFFVGVVIIILTTSTSLRAFDPLLSCLMGETHNSLRGYGILLLTDATARGHYPYPSFVRLNNTRDAEHRPGC
jgi:hypothetical protein